MIARARARAARALSDLIQWRVILALGLLLVVFRSVTAGLADVTRGVDVQILLPGALGGLLIGWLLASWNVSGRVSTILSLAVGLFYTLVRLGNLGSNLWEALRQVGLLGAAVVRWPSNGPPDLGPLYVLLVDLVGNLLVLLDRALSWSLALSFGNPVFDPIGAAFAWSMLLWLMATWASWGVRREWSPLLAVLPAGLLFAVTVAFTRGGVNRLLPLLGATLLLTGIVNQDAREHRWKALGILFPGSLSRGVGLTATVLTVVLVTAAGIAPSISFRRLVEFAQQFTDSRSDRPSLADSLGLQPRAPAMEDPFAAVRAPGLPRRHLMGSGPELSERVIMIVTLDQATVQAAPELPPFYWRALTYDIYNGRGWSASGSEVALYDAGERALPVDSPYHFLVHEEVRGVETLGGLIHVAGDLVSIDQDYEVAWRSSSDMFGATAETNAYHAESLVPLVDKETLRAAGDDYPEWVQDRYLALPESLPRRVRTLALELTATEPTAYDRAKAIEAYLRTFPYTLEVGPPIPGRDVADYFLFDLRKGYCDYYATAMVVLARAAGLPARLAVGYIGGTYDVDQTRYIVSEAEAHSWVEVYFPSVGWVGFEPTGGRPSLDRPEKTALAIPQELERPLLPPVTDVSAWTGLALLGLLGSLGLGLTAAVMWNGVDRYRLQRLPPSLVATRLYKRLQRFAPRLSIPLRPGATPYEFAEILGRHVGAMAGGDRLRAVFAPAPAETFELADLAVLAQYSPRPLSPARRARAVEIWTQLQRRLLLAWMWQRFGGLFRVNRGGPTG